MSKYFYDKITFLSEIIYKNNSIEFFIKYYLTIINKLLNNSLNKIERINYIHYNSAENYEFLILSKLINILCNYYINKINYKESSINIKELIIPNNIEETMKKLIKINLDEYFPNNNYKREDLLIRDNSRKKMSNQTASLIYFIFKYFDLYLLLFYRENFIQFYNIMINKENLLFKYYRDYKILSMQKNKEKNNCKETIAFNYYIIEKMSNPDLIVNNNTFEINANHINEYKLSNKNDIFDLTLKNIENANYNKIIIYCKDDETNKYYYQDIIDLNKIFLSDNNYKFRVNKDIYLIPQKNIDTFLYSIENEKFIKYEEIHKFIWNIGFDGNNYLLVLSEEDNLVYNFLEHENYYEFMINNKFEDNNIIKNKLIKFNEGENNNSSFIYGENGDIFLIDENIYKYKWLQIKDKNINKYQISIPNIKIISISSNYNECYVVGSDGNLYENKGNTFNKIIPPENNKKFLQCSCGDDI